jgi:hypothetical protein
MAKISSNSSASTVAQLPNGSAGVTHIFANPAIKDNAMVIT